MDTYFSIKNISNHSNEINYDDIIFGEYKKKNPINIYSQILSGGIDFTDNENTAYSKKNDIFDSINFHYMNEDRLLDIEREIISFEKKYNKNSENFYIEWLSDKRFDREEINKWMDLYTYLKYVGQ